MMRSLLFIGLLAVALGCSDGRAFAASIASVEYASVAAAEHNEGTRESFAAEAGKIAVLAGAGLIGTLAAVGLRRVWFNNPIRDPYREGPA
ncbi:MAG TPA: hypothetical protein VKV96_04785 [Roseiarcus sp.]|nr:hypothetical protein [Roseiarcus sp.]